MERYMRRYLDTGTVQMQCPKKFVIDKLVSKIYLVIVLSTLSIPSIVAAPHSRKLPKKTRAASTAGCSFP